MGVGRHGSRSLSRGARAYNRVSNLPAERGGRADVAILKMPCEEGVVLAGRAALPCVQAAEPWGLAATILGSSMGVIDGTAVNVALAALQADHGATVAEVQWVVE